MAISFGVPSSLTIAGTLTLTGVQIWPTGNRLEVGSPTNATLMVSDSGAWVNQSSFGASSGGLQNQIAQSGQQAWNAADNNGRNLSGNLTQTGIALVALNLTTSGALYQQINLAAGVLSLNGATGSVTIASAPANANYVGISNSGTTIYVSGLNVPVLSGVNFAGTQISGNGGDIFVAPGATLGIGSSIDFNNGVLQLATHTTSGGGIGLGPDNSIYRSGPGAITSNSTLQWGPNTGGLLDYTSSIPRVFSSTRLILQANGGDGTNDVTIARGGSDVAYFGNVSTRLFGGNSVALTLNASGDALLGRNLSIGSGLFFADTGNYTRSGGASVAQLIAISGFVTTQFNGAILYSAATFI